MKESFTWSDNSGNHLLVLSKKVTPRSDSSRNGEQFAFHNLVKNNVAEQTWRTYDFIDDCECDLATNFIPDAASVNELDGNDESKVWLAYLFFCRGDVSPCNITNHA